MTILLSNLLFEAIDTSKRCIVTAGTPGSGKSTAINQITANLDLRKVDPDDLLAYVLKRDNIPLDFSKQSLEQRQQVNQHRDDFRRQITKARYLTAKQGKGILFNTTGASFSWTMKHIKPLINQYDYDVKMVFVDSSLEQTLERNRGRERKLPDHVIEQQHEDIQRNKPKYQSFFGPHNFHYINNTGDLANLQQEIKRVESELLNWKPAG